MLFLICYHAALNFNARKLISNYNNTESSSKLNKTFMLYVYQTFKIFCFPTKKQQKYDCVEFSKCSQELIEQLRDQTQPNREIARSVASTPSKEPSSFQQIQLSFMISVS